VQLLETYFEVEDGEVENLAPQQDASAGTYAFDAGNGAAPGGGFTFGMQQG
jgi:importin subunit alpha-6/7